MNETTLHRRQFRRAKRLQFAIAFVTQVDISPRVGAPNAAFFAFQERKVVSFTTHRFPGLVAETKSLGLIQTDCWLVRDAGGNRIHFNCFAGSRQVRDARTRRVRWNFG